MDYKRIRPVRRNLWVGEPGSRPNLIMDSVPGERTNRQVPADSPKVRLWEVTAPATIATNSGWITVHSKAAICGQDRGSAKMVTINDQLVN